MKKENKEQFLMGIREGIPIMIGFLPIATTFALLAIQYGLSKTETNIMSVCLLAGASQMMAVKMLALGAGTIQVVFAVFILNLRHLIMSSCVMNKLNKTSLFAKCILAFGVTDETFAVISTKSEAECSSYFFGGLAFITYFSWVFGTFLGSFFIQFIPSSISKSMGIALYAMFIAIITPDMRKEKTIALTVLLSAVCNTLLSLVIPSSPALIISMVLGAYIGVILLEREEDNQYEDNIQNHTRDVPSHLCTENAAGSSDGTYTCTRET